MDTSELCPARPPALTVVSRMLATNMRRGEKMSVSQGVAGTMAMLPTANAVVIQLPRSTSRPTPPRRQKQACS